MERWNSQRTNRCEKPSISVSPASNSGRILSTPSASCFAPGPLGTSLVFLYGLLTNPIGRDVNMVDLSPLSTIGSRNLKAERALSFSFMSGHQHPVVPRKGID